jgi:hypothetical protein
MGCLNKGIDWYSCYGQYLLEGKWYQELYREIAGTCYKVP